MILVTLADFVSKEKKIAFARNTTELMIHERYHMQKFHSSCWEDTNTNVNKGKILTIKRKKTIRRNKRKTYYWPYICKTPKTGTGYNKVGCLVVFNTKKLFTVPKYKIPTDTRYNRDKAAKLVKKFLLP